MIGKVIWKQQWLAQPIGVFVGKRPQVKDRVRRVNDTMVVWTKYDHVIAGISATVAEVLNVVAFGIRRPKPRFKVIPAYLATIAVIGFEVRREPGIALVLKLGDESEFLIVQW